jgi:hypothetical protein
VTTVVASVFSEFLIDDAVLPTVVIKDLPTKRETVAVDPAAVLITLILTDVVAIEAIVVATADNVWLGCLMILGVLTATALRTFVPERVSVATVVPIPRTSDDCCRRCGSTAKEPLWCPENYRTCCSRRSQCVRWLLDYLRAADDRSRYEIPRRRSY